MFEELRLEFYNQLDSDAIAASADYIIHLPVHPCALLMFTDRNGGI